MLVETKSASLNTMAVTIQALHVEGKQMTLAVFRQLPTLFVDKLEDEDADNCHLWGTVCYSIPNEANEWLVFSYNKILYKQPLINEKPQEYILTNDGYKKNGIYLYQLNEYEIYKKIKEYFPQLFIAV